MVKIQTEKDGYRGEGKGIHRNWMSTAIISISVIRVQTVFQTGVWFCYKCSRLVSGSAISVPDRCLVLPLSVPGQAGVWFWRKVGFRQNFGFIFSITIFCKNTKGDGDRGW